MTPPAAGVSLVLRSWPLRIERFRLVSEDITVSGESTPVKEDPRSIAQITELVGGLAHELRNPLSTMMINLKLLAEDLQDEQSSGGDVRRRALIKVDALRREAERLQNLFDEFLNLAGPFTLHKAQIDINLIVSRLAQFLEPMARANNVSVTVATAESPLMCLADEELLSQALLNIVLNGQQAMTDGGYLRIAAGEGEGEAFISVSDTGVGIAAEDAERVFRPFFSTKAKGSGLGLSITRRIIEEHGGTLTFSSELSKGTTFTIRLPACPKDGSGETGDSASAEVDG